MSHAGTESRPSRHINYVHLGASLGYLQGLINEAILTHPRLKSERKLALVKAIGKIVWIQNDLFAKWQVQDDKGRALDRPMRVESEGYLHGRNVLARPEEPLIEPETPMEEMSCPFEQLRF